MIVFLGYSATLVAVHSTTFSQLASSVIQRDRATERQVKNIDRRIKTIGAHKLALLKRIETKLRHELHDSSLTARNIDRLLQRNIPRARALNRLESSLTARSVDIAERLPPVPSSDALPAWFSHLGGFFPLAAQILGAGVIALALLGRWSKDLLAEQLLRLAMFFALLGMITAVIGSLPDLHRGFQALLLGYVTAGLVSTLTVLGLFASAAVQLNDG